MKRTLTTALGFAAALATLGSPAALAVAGDAWYGTNRHDDVRRVEIAPADRVVIVEDRADPVIVERREYVVTEPREYVVAEPRYVVTEPREVVVVGTAEPRVVCDPLFPEMGHAIGCGLFNKWGPNDFGD